MTRSIHLRGDAVDRLTAAAGVERLTRKQQAALLDVPYTSFWQLIVNGRRAGVQTVADILAGVDRFAKRYECPRPSFEELFEIRENEDKPAVAMAA